jgi:uncharacterized protein (UPF0548 family)
MPDSGVISALGAIADELRTAPFNYAEVGATRQDRLPRNYHHLEQQVTVGSGRERYQALVDELMSWQLHARSGLAMQVSDDRVRQGSVLVATLDLGPFRVRTRCRVVYLIDEDRRTGFAYGTLPGHPERGEERFLVELTDDDRVVFGLRAFSLNAGLLARLGGPVSRRVQAMVNRRYLAAAAQ